MATDEYIIINDKQYRKFIKCEGLPHGYHTIYLDGNDDKFDTLASVLFSVPVENKNFTIGDVSSSYKGQILCGMF